MDPNEETLSTTKYHKYPRNQRQMEEKVLQQVTKSTIKKPQNKATNSNSSKSYQCSHQLTSSNVLH